MPDYTVVKEGWIAGRLRRAGERVRLTAAQAKYENVTPAGGDAAPAAAPAAPKRGQKGGAA